MGVLSFFLVIVDAADDPRAGRFVLSNGLSLFAFSEKVAISGGAKV